MGLDPISVAAIGLTLAGATTSGAGAVIQRRNAKEQSKELSNAQRVNQQQLVDKQQLERNRINAEAGQIEARMRVLAGESGIAIGGSIDDLLQQTDYDRALNESISRLNLGNSLNALNSQVAAQQSQIKSSVQNPLLAGLMGGLGGLSTGLSLGSSIKSLDDALPRGPRDPLGPFNSFDEAPRGG